MSDPKAAIDAVLDGTSRYAVLCGDATEVMGLIPSETIHVSYNDPPYGLSEQTTENIVECLRTWLDGKVYSHSKNGFMQATWDAYVPGPEAWREVNRVLKPGGYNVSFSSTRTVDLLGMAIRLAGFSVRPGWSWLQGCLSDDTEILVGSEWKKYSDVSVGDEAVCYDPSDGTYRREGIERVFVYDYDDTAYRVHSDRTDQLVTRNHRCLVERGGAFVFCEAGEAAREREVRVPVLEDVQAVLQSISVRDEEQPDEDDAVRSGVRIGGDSGSKHEVQKARGGATCRDFHMRGMRGRENHRSVSHEKRQREVLLEPMPRRMECVGRENNRAVPPNRCDGETGVDGIFCQGPPREDEWREQSRMERWRDAAESSRVVCCGEVRAMPDGVHRDGEDGRVRDGAPHHRGVHPRADASANRGRPPYESRPDGQSSGESRAVLVEQRPQDVRVDGLTISDLARFDAIHYRGVVWCVKVPTGAFVARRNGKVFVTGNSGFPKSLDVSRSIDERSVSDVSAMRQWVKSLGTRDDIATATGVTPRQVDHWIGENTPCPQTLTATRFAKLCEVFGNVPDWADKMFPAVREVVGKIRHARSGGEDFGKLIGAASTPKVADVTAPSSEAAKQWDGYGTDVKPAYEPLVVARKNMDGTVAANVLAHGCGVLNIDAARIGHVTVGDGNLALNPHLRATINGGNGGNIFPREEERRVVEPHAKGRFPAAVVGVHDEDCELVGVTKTKTGMATFRNTETGAKVQRVYGDSLKREERGEYGYADPDGTETVDEWRCTETCAVAELARQSNDAGVHGAGSARGGGLGDHDRVSMFVPNAPNNGMRYGDFGSAARFFYQAKASASDRLAYMTCSDGCKHNDRAAWLKDARASVRDGRQEPIGGKCIDVDVAAPAAHAAITAMFVREVLDEVLGITRQALGEDVVSSGSTCIDATLVTNAVASAMADQNSDEIAAALAERGTALAPRTSLCARSSTSAEGESQEDSTCVPRNDDNADPAWPSPGFCRSCGSPRTNYQHPTVKPQSLANWHAKLLSLPAEVSPVAIVPFCGTGIEAKALLDAGFRVIAIDIDPRHVTMTEFRLANGAPDEARTTSRSDSPARPMPSKPTKVLRGKPAKQTDNQLDLFGKKS